MAGLEEELSLDVSKAESSIDRLGKQLEQLATKLRVDLSAAFDNLGSTVQITAEVNADTSAVAGEIQDAAAETEATTEIAVDADTSEAEAEIESIEGTDVEIAVDADTSEAQGAIDDIEAPEVEVVVTADTSEATESIGDLGGAASATGSEVAGLGAGLKGLGPKALAATGGTVALAAGLKTAFTSAVDAQGSLQAFEQTLGDSADEIRNVNVGTLNADLNELAISLGSSDEGLQDAATKIFALGEASGAARPELEQTTESIIALAARAVAIRPSLGDVGTVAESMGNALARGGRPLAAFGISLTSAEINARALADTGKTVAADLTIYEKSAAGAALATERLGDSLGEDIAAGQQNAAIRLRAISERIGELFETVGQPLVAPGLDALETGLEALAPIAEATAAALSLVAKAQKLVVGGAGDLIGKLGSAVPLLDQVTDKLPDLDFSVATVSLEDFNAATGLSVDALSAEQRELETVSEMHLTAAVASGIYTRGQVQVALDAAFAEGSIHAYTDAVGALEAEQATAGAETTNLSADFATLAEVVGTATDQVGTSVGAMADTVFAAQAEAGAALDALSTSVAENVGDINAAFQDLNDDGVVSLQEFTTNLETQFTAQATFLTNIKALNERGATDLALILLQQGEAGATAAAQAADLNDAQLADKERFIDETNTANGLLAANYELTAADIIGSSDAMATQVNAAGRRIDIGTSISDAIGFGRSVAERESPSIGNAIGRGAAIALAAQRIALIAQATAMAYSIAQTVRDALGVHSPSRVFEDIGNQIGDGWAIGIDDSGKQVVAAAENIVRQASMVAAAPLPELAMAGTTNSFGGINVQVSVTGEMTPETARMAGREVGAGIEQQLRHIEVDIGRG